jgi:glycosyltransferase involved in cell wall biosynthesis
LLGEKIGHVMQYASCVFVCNDYLASYARKWNRCIEQVPTVVQDESYAGMRKKKKKHNGTFVIRWIGSRTTSPYLLTLLPLMERFVRRYEDVVFRLVGFDTDLIDGRIRKECHIEVIPWDEMMEVEAICSFDVGIMPLPDTPWTKGKCGFKLIQYMACAKAVTASPVGVNRQMVEEGVNGFLCDGPNEWERAWQQLYEERIRCKEMGQAGLRRYKERYLYEKVCRAYMRKLNAIRERL